MMEKHLPRISPRIKLKIKTGDMVQVMAGKDKGAKGRVVRVLTKKLMVVVEGHEKDKDGNQVPLNAVTKHRKARTATEQSARIKMAAPLHISKVMVIDPHSGEPTRVGRRLEGGKLVRYAKKSNETIDVK